MMVQEDLCVENKFPISNGAAGATSYVEYSGNEKFDVYDTIGLCESSKGTIPHKEAIKKIRHYFSAVQSPLHYICYVKKGDRFTNEDKSTFKEFKKIFSGGESNFVIIITDSTPKWASENVQTIRNYFGNLPIIAVDFPFNDRYDAEIQQGIRIKSREHLRDSLLKLRYNGVMLEILKTSEAIETKVANIVGFLPIIGATYKLISSGVYYFILQKPNIARRRLIEGIGGGAGDIRALIGGDHSVIPQRIFGRLLTRN
ncbi:4325_t:CDS:1 [Scutellospora calospora]|uniref:4325_t:CDS:1 n=1 Tax=Scutellospora calospora TaxID=85575 RepID=A0ACA9LW64_9GLOM|nr:4325_t:CDS:1 [Scutellospora calospora]